MEKPAWKPVHEKTLFNLNNFPTYSNLDATCLFSIVLFKDLNFAVNKTQTTCIKSFSIIKFLRFLHTMNMVQA